MPSTSDKQRRFMAAAANNPKFAKKAGIKQSVAKEFHSADRKGYQGGGLAQVAKNYFSQSPNSNAGLIQRPGAMINPMLARPPQGGGLAQATKPMPPQIRPPGGGATTNPVGPQWRGAPPPRAMPGPGGRGGGPRNRMPPQGFPGGGRGGGPRNRMPPQGQPPMGGFPAPGGRPPQQLPGGLQQMLMARQQQFGAGMPPGAPSAAMPPQTGYPGMPPGAQRGMPLRGPQGAGGAFRGAPGRLPPGLPPNAALRAPQDRSANYGNRLNSMMSGLGGRPGYAGGGTIRKKSNA